MRAALSLMQKPALAAALLLVAGCFAETTEAECGPDALGVSRTLVLTADSPPPYTLLQPGEVILTFDDGPDVFRTRPVLKELDAQCTRATFFLLGKAAKARPGMVRDIVAAGHTVGSHSMDHANLTQMSVEDAVENATDARKAVEAATGVPEPFFRFPFVATNPDLSAAIHAAGLIDVTVTADGADWTGNTPEEAVDMILAKLEQHDRRGMVLLHDPMKGSAARTRYLLQSLKEHGYRVVALEAGEG